MLLGPYFDDAWCKWEFEITFPTLQIAEEIETKLPVGSRNKICILNINLLRAGEGNEVNRGFPFKHRQLGYLHAANYCLSLRTSVARVNNWNYKLFTYLTSDLYTLASTVCLYPSYLQHIFKPFLILTIIIQIYVRTTLRQLPSWKISVPSQSSLHSLQSFFDHNLPVCFT